MTTDEQTPSAELSEEDDIGKSLRRQLVIVGGIVFLILLGVFFGAI